MLCGGEERDVRGPARNSEAIFGSLGDMSPGPDCYHFFWAQMETSTPLKFDRWSILERKWSPIFGFPSMEDHIQMVGMLSSMFENLESDQDQSVKSSVQFHVGIIDCTPFSPFSWKHRVRNWSRELHFGRLLSFAKAQR